MTGTKLISFTGFLTLVGIFTFTFFYAFESGFDRGHMYPEHSSLRADPRGVMMLFETLERIEAINASRSFEPFSKWWERIPVRPQDAAYIILDARSSDLHDPALLSFLQLGGRLIITPASFRFNPPARSNQGATPKSKSDNADDGSSDSIAVTPEANQLTQSLTQLVFHENVAGHDADAQLQPHSPLTAQAPESIRWQAKAYMRLRPHKDGTADWDILYAVHRQPVIVGQQIGKGQIIVLADGLPLTNESLYGETDTDFFKWLLGNRTRIIFDEYHFGIIQPRGIALLVRQYNLELTALTLFASFILLVWHGASPLLPNISADRDHNIQSRTAMSGYRDLLQRYLKHENQLLTCLDEWKSAFMTRPIDRDRHAKHFAEARNIALQEAKKTRRHRDLQSAYTTITEILNRRR